MSPNASIQYPPEAFTAGNLLWWKATHQPGRKAKLGDEIKLCAWLNGALQTGDTFTMPELREALGNAAPNTAEHLNRRLRELRVRDGWVIPSNKDDGALPVGTYRVETKGWHPGSGVPRARKNAISQKTRRLVFERDGRRCTVCGVGANEPYPGEGATASITVGHILANANGGSSSDTDNLRTECRRCNEPVRQEMRVPETLAEVLPDIRNLKKLEKQRLREWLAKGTRTRDRLDLAHDRARLLSPSERADLLALVEAMAR